MLWLGDGVSQSFLSRRVGIAAATFIALFASLAIVPRDALGQDTPARPAGEPVDATKQSAQPPAEPQRGKTQAELEAELSKLLSGATLEGSFTSTGPGQDASRLSVDKYTLGEVRKLAGNTWMIQARMRDALIPLPLPIEWAGDTPVIVVDNFTIPGMGTFSARVMFFADHYAGYWKHDERGGSMFGVVRRAGAEGAPAATAPANETTPMPTTPPATTPPTADDKSKQ